MDSDHDGVVTWVASQATNPALQALMREAEREKTTRLSWSAPLADAPYRLPPAGSSASDPRRTVRPQPLPSSLQPHRSSARPRSSHHSTAPSPHINQPEASTFIELLKDVSKQLDRNSHKKQRLAARAREKDRDRSLPRSASSLDTKPVSARPLLKTSSASAISPVPSRPCPDRLSASLGAPHPDHVSGKSPSTSLPNINLNCNPKLLPGWPNTPTTKASSSDDADSPMRDVLDLTESDTDSKHPPTSLADTAMSIEVDDDDDDDLYGDSGMDISFYQPPPPKPRPPQPSHPPAPTQRARTGPPPLGMRRAPQLYPSQSSSSQVPKGQTVPRFKPPLLATGGSMNKGGTRAKPVVTAKLPPRASAKVAPVKTVECDNRDADSSFDVSFDMDPDALEETMKAYDRI